MLPVRSRRSRSSQKIKDVDNGEIELTLKLGSLAEIMRWVLSWGDHARVRWPDELRHQIKTAAQKPVCYYEKGGD